MFDSIVSNALGSDSVGHLPGAVSSVRIRFFFQDKAETRTIITHWKPSLMVGIFSALGSVGWFSAMTLERVAYVKTVSQLEVILSILVSYLVFKERSRVHEFIGMSLVIVAIFVLLLMA